MTAPLSRGDISQRCIEAARRLYASTDLEILDNAPVTRGRDDGYWVQARVWVYDDQLEPLPGPTYSVWMADALLDRTSNTTHGPWAWVADFTLDDDIDGFHARAAAHEYARHLRYTYPRSCIAVRPAGSAPLPIHSDTN